MSYFLNSIEFKNIKIKDNNNLHVNKYEQNLLAQKYNKYIYVLQKLDNYNTYELNHYEFNKKSLLNLDYNNNKLFHVNKNAKLLKNKVLEEHMININSRKMNYNLTKPHYFFTYQYNEKSMPTQIKHWTSSTYNFLKSEKRGNNFKDIYTSKLIKLFFNIKFLKKRSIWDNEMMIGLKLKVKPSFMKEVNTSIKYTSSRSRLAVVKLTTFPWQLLTLDWVRRQFDLSTILKEFFTLNKSDFSGGYYAKKKKYMRKLKRIFISRPLFKHTSFNLIIDLFVYNNKRYTFRRLSNISIRRSIYKYMYSMYIDYYEKIKDTINRPRFFYINLIEPRIHKYYNWIVKYYGELLVIKNKPMILVLYLLLLQANFVNKLKLNSIKNNIINNINKYFSYNIIDNSENKRYSQNINSLLLSKKGEINVKNKHNIIFKRFNLKKNFYNINIYKYLLIKENNKLFNLSKKSIEKKEYDSNETIHQKKKKNIKNIKSKYIKYKNYLIDLERKGNSPVDLNSLSLWNSKGLGKHYRTPDGIIDNFPSKLKNKKNSSFSYKNYKKKYLTDYNENNVLFDNNSKKKNSDLWYKRRNKLVPSVSHRDAINLFNNSYKKNNIFNSNKDKININLISKVKEEKITKFENNEDFYSIEGLNKEQYINEIHKEIKKSTLLNNVFTSFYIYNKGSKLNKGSNSNSFINTENINERIQYVNKKNKFQDLKDKNNSKNFTNSKILWDNLDYSIIGALSKHIYINKGILFGSNSFQINLLLNEIKKFKGFGNIWYLMYFINVIKKEFYIVNKDIIISKNFDVRPELSYKKDNIFIFDKNNIFENKTLNYNNKKYKAKLHIWPSLYSNKREDNLNFKLGYNEKIFKPYYRYMIPFIILNSYYSLSYYIGYLNPLNSISSYLTKKLNSIKHNNIKLFNFLTVKILLDLLHYNYRSWIRIKAKYYYIRKLRYYEKKFYKLTVNNWLAGLRFLKKLRKTPRNFWLRYHKGASYYFERIVQNAELDTKRKIFVPFVLYFEDILFNIYGKWVIVRLWPLKKYYLSSYILAKRVLLLILWRRKRGTRKWSASRISLRLIENFKYLEIQKAYKYFIYNSSPWPRDLLLKLSNANKTGSLSYNELEFANLKEDRFHYLNSYTLLFNNLSNFIPLFNYNYRSVHNDYIKFMNKIHFLNKKPRFFSRNEFVYFWLLPFRNYLMKLTRTTDITGVKFKISGRPSFKRSNNRKVNNIYNYGNRLVPKHYSRILDKSISLPIPRLRGYLKSQIESSISISKSRNGSVSLKVWISSLLSVDVHELLLHLVRIKGLYYQLVNRYYSTDSSLRNWKWK